MTMSPDNLAALKRLLVDALTLADRLELDIAAIHIDDALTLVTAEGSAGAPPLIDCILTSLAP